MRSPRGADRGRGRAMQERWSAVAAQHHPCRRRPRMDELGLLNAPGFGAERAGQLASNAVARPPAGEPGWRPTLARWCFRALPPDLDRGKAVSDETPARRAHGSTGWRATAGWRVRAAIGAANLPFCAERCRPGSCRPAKRRGPRCRRWFRRCRAQPGRTLHHCGRASSTAMIGRDAANSSIAGSRRRPGDSAAGGDSERSGRVEPLGRALARRRWLAGRGSRRISRAAEPRSVRGVVGRGAEQAGHAADSAVFADEGHPPGRRSPEPSIRSVAEATSTWRKVAQDVGARPAEIGRMASAFEHRDFDDALLL